MLHGGAHISDAKRQRVVENYAPPSYHWQGFGRKSSKPPWFDQMTSQKRRPIFLWEGDAVGVPRVCPKKLGLKAPYNHSTDDRLYRPVVPLERMDLSTLVPAPSAERLMVERDYDCGMTEKQNGRSVEHGFKDKCEKYTAAARGSAALLEENKQRSRKTTMQGLIFNGIHDKEGLYLPYSRTRADFKVGGATLQEVGHNPSAAGYMTLSNNRTQLAPMRQPHLLFPDGAFQAGIRRPISSNNNQEGH